MVSLLMFSALIDALDHDEPVARETRLWDELSLGGALVGASASPSWVAGGVAEARWMPWDRAALRGEVGWFRFAPQEGPHANVVEARLGAEAPLTRGERGHLLLAGELAGGADRMLDPWVRAGLALRGSLGRGVAP